MIVSLKVKAASGKSCVIPLEDSFLVYVRAKPLNNAANEEVIKLLEKFFGKKVKILRGFHSQKKILEILG